MSRSRMQRHTTRRYGFTLTELLIVMGIIVLVALVAVPSFRALTGGRSTEAAQNQLAAFIQRARQEAIGVQEMRGVAFLRLTGESRVTAVMVREVGGPIVTPPQTLPPGFQLVEVYLDAVPDRDHLVMPVGVGIQTIDDCAINPPAAAATPSPHDDVRGDDAYIGLNISTVNMPGINGDDHFVYGGVILFDGFGRLVKKQYAFRCFRQVPAAGGGYTRTASEIAQLWGMNIPAADNFASSTDFKPGRTQFTINPATGAIVYTVPPITASFGFVLYDSDAFDALQYTQQDPQCEQSMPNYTDVSEASWQSSQTGRSDEAIEERWLDANAIPILVNRNNGTLLRGQ
jgi:prepilin-type N-terminal cleavage/methylation domain-containing protein